MGSSFIHLIRTESNEILFILEKLSPFWPSSPNPKCYEFLQFSIFLVGFCFLLLFCVSFCCGFWFLCLLAQGELSNSKSFWKTLELWNNSHCSLVPSRNHSSSFSWAQSNHFSLRICSLPQGHAPESCVWGMDREQDDVGLHREDPTKSCKTSTLFPHSGLKEGESLRAFHTSI